MPRLEPLSSLGRLNDRCCCRYRSPAPHRSSRERDAGIRSPKAERTRKCMRCPGGRSCARIDSSYLMQGRKTICSRRSTLKRNFHLKSVLRTTRLSSLFKNSGIASPRPKAKKEVCQSRWLVPRITHLCVNRRLLGVVARAPISCFSRCVSFVAGAYLTP